MNKAEIFQTLEKNHFEDSVAWMIKNNLDVRLSTALGNESLVLMHMLAKHKLPVDVFTVDTGRLFPETLELIEKVQTKLNIPIRVLYPDARRLENWVNTHGVNAFYKSIELRKGCCFHRKVDPFARGLRGADVWITGLRASQSANRLNQPKVAWNENHKVVKYNPLIDWSKEAIDQYIDDHGIPTNPLAQRGFLSIGCAPCTRPTDPSEDERAGRWWWENSHKECGIHVN